MDPPARHGTLPPRTALSAILIRGETIAQIGCGVDHYAVVCESGRAYTFGGNAHGQLGLRGTGPGGRSFPTHVEFLAHLRVTQAACGRDFTLFLGDDGRVYGCGTNPLVLGRHGGVGAGPQPVPWVGTGFAVRIAAGLGHAFALDASGTLLSCGQNSAGQLGRLDDSIFHFTAVPSRPRAVDVACGGFHSALLDADGLVLTAGWNRDGQLGSGSTPGPGVFRRVSLPSRVAAFACGFEHTVAVGTDGTVGAWGRNLRGQLGVGHRSTCVLPTRVLGVGSRTIARVIAGRCFTVLVAEGGAVLVCGGLEGEDESGDHLVATPAGNHPSLMERRIDCALSYSVRLLDGGFQPEPEGSVEASTGSGNGEVATGSGNGEVATGSGNGEVATGSGNGDVATGSGNGEVATGSGNGEMATGFGNGVVATGSGNGEVATGSGNGVVATGSGNGEVATGSGNGEVATGSGNGVVATGSGNGEVATRSGNGVVATGSGNGEVATGLGNLEGPRGSESGEAPKESGSGEAPTLSEPVEVPRGSESWEAPTVSGNVEAHKESGSVEAPRGSESEEAPQDRTLADLEKSVGACLECPICFATMTAPIRMCVQGHSVCGDCRSRIPACILCRRPFVDARNFALESLGSEIRLPCGMCLKRLPVRRLEEHRETCPSRPRSCPLRDTCAWRGRSDHLWAHASSDHPAQAWETPRSFSHEDFAGGLHTQALRAGRRTFLLRRKYDAGSGVFRAAVQTLGPSAAPDGFRYQLDLSSQDEQTRFTFARRVCVGTDSAGSVFLYDDCVAVKGELLDMVAQGGKLACRIDVMAPA